MDFDGTKVCGVPDHVGAGGTCLWPFPDVLVYVQPSGGFAGIDLPAVVEEACASWRGVCATRIRVTADQSLSNLVVSWGRVDGPQGTLAWCELPCFGGGNVRRLQLLLDNSESWVVADNPPSGKIDLRRVLRHELGHALGISHIGQGNLMAPTYSATIVEPQRGDVMEAVVRYGHPATVPPAIPVTPTTPNPFPAVPGLPPGIPIPDFANRPKLRKLLGAFKKFWDIFNTLNPTDWAGLEAE